MTWWMLMAMTCYSLSQVCVRNELPPPTSAGMYASVADCQEASRRWRRVVNGMPERNTVTSLACEPRR